MRKHPINSPVNCHILLKYVSRRFIPRRLDLKCFVQRFWALSWIADHAAGLVINIISIPT